MRAYEILSTLEMVDDRYIEDAERYRLSDGSTVKNQHRRLKLRKRALLLAAVIAAILVLCGFGIFEQGLWDRWLQQPDGDPTQTVRSAIENQMDKEYTLSVRFESAEIDQEETERVAAMYTGSELAQSRGWTDGYLAEHFVVVRAKYYVEYDHTKTWLDDGEVEQYFYLAQELKTGAWVIVDNTTSGEPLSRSS